MEGSWKGDGSEADSMPLLVIRTPTSADGSPAPQARDCVEETDIADTIIKREEIGTSLNAGGDHKRASVRQHVLMFLYGSHFLSRWGDRMWEFAVGLFMIEVWPESLLLAAVYGLTEAAAIAAFGVFIGSWVDRTPRLKVVQISIGLQNSSIIIAGIAVGALLGFPGPSLPGGPQAFTALVVVVNLCGAIATLGGLAGNIVVERDWVVVISENQGPDMLPRMNSVMRRIDLSCKLLAPVLVGALISGVSALTCAILIALWNAFSAGFEYWCLHSVYWNVEALQEKVQISEPSTQIQDPVTGSSEVIALHEWYHPVQVDEGDVNQNERTSHGSHWLEKFYMGWRVYCRQEVVLAGIALALLYFTVLSFGSLMTAVLNWRGVPAYVLGLARGVAALVGILATITYPMVQSRLKTIRTGLWSIWIQWSLLSLCATSVLVHNGVEASAMLIGGVAASRLGLWMFDLSVTQLMQESVPEHERGVVGGVQNSLQSIMDMLSYVVAIIISDPKKFWIPVMISYASVGLAAVLYASYVRKVRGHLVHLDRLMHKLRNL